MHNTPIFSENVQGRSMRSMVAGNYGMVITLVNVYVDLVVFTRIAGTS